MAPVSAHDLECIDSPFHKDLIGNVDGLIQHLEDTIAFLDCQEGDKRYNPAVPNREQDMWDKPTGGFSLVLGGLQAFITGLQLEYSNLEREAEKLEEQRTCLETERDELIEKSHELHCRIQYNALEMRLEQSFSDIERCSSVYSARCFKDEAHENLRRTNEIIRTASLRNCQLDKEIINEMEHIINTFQDYQNERETYDMELDLFDVVRRRKITSWMNDPARSDTERELGEGVIEYLDLCSNRRHFGPKIISNTLQMQAMNESLTFDRQDNLRRLDEMTSLQKKVANMCGLTTVLPRKAPAATDLTGMNDQSIACQQQISKNDDAYKEFLECQEGYHVTSGHGLHRCPRKINLATDPITDPALQQELDSVLRWEVQDEPQASTEGPVEESDEVLAAAATAAAGDPASEGETLTTTSQDLEEPVKEMAENLGGSAASLCGDAVLSQEKLTVDINETCDLHLPRYGPKKTNTAVDAMEAAVPRDSHLLLHHVESATGLLGSPGQRNLMFGLVKKKSCGGPSSMTAIVDWEKEASGKMTSQSQRLSDDRETRSQGWVSGGGRTGSSGTSNNSGNPRN